MIARPGSAALAHVLSPGDRVSIATLRDLTAGLLAALAPELVVFPLISARHDAPGVIERLVALGYGGRVSVLAPRLPDRAMVEAELSALAPSLRLVLVEAPDDGTGSGA